MLRAKNAMLISICSIFFQMASISSLFEGKVSGPYARPLKVKVVATDEPVSYRGQDGTEKQALSVAVSDGNDCIKLVCYDPAKFPKLRLGNSIVLREVIRKGDEMPRYVVATRTNQIFLTGSINVPAAHTTEGIHILNPAPAEPVPVSQAL